MFKIQAGIGERGERVPGPPWILGHRGAPREAPENTLVSLRRAIELGLDGVEYDVHACASGEAVLLHDDTLERTTSGAGPVAAATLMELTGLDAGGWFRKRFVGEPLPLLEEALDLPGESAGTWPQHMIELKDPGFVAEVVRQVRERHPPLTVRIASFHKSVCLEARDLGMSAMFLAVEANKDDRNFVRDERIQAYGVAAEGWRVAAGELDWPCERWAWSVDEPADLLVACRAPLFGFNTNQPLRALATRALVRLCPGDTEGYPVEVPALVVEERSAASAADEFGGWSGSWKTSVGVRNPFGFPVEFAVALEVSGGAFEIEGLPARGKLVPGERTRVPLALRGGSWSPGSDPIVHVRFVWRTGPGRPPEALILDAPLHRIRRAVVDERPRRLALLCERPGEAQASMTIKRRGHELLLWVENPGGLEDVRACVRLGSLVRRGGRGVRVFLPEDFDSRREGIAFSVGFEGREKSNSGRVRLRRFAGGLPEGLGSGAPGVLLPASGA